MTQRPKPTLGQTLLSQRDRGLITERQAFMMFVNQVELDAIPAAVEALPPAFRQELENFLASLEIGSPGREEDFLVGGIYHFGDVTAEEADALYQGIAKKNRVTAEAIWHYLGLRKRDDAGENW